MSNQESNINLINKERTSKNEKQPRTQISVNKRGTIFVQIFSLQGYISEKTKKSHFLGYKIVHLFIKIIIITWPNNSTKIYILKQNI